MVARFCLCGRDADCSYKKIGSPYLVAASFAAAFSGVADIFFRAFAVPLFAEAVSKIQGVKSLGGEKPKGYDAKTQYRPTQVVVVYERDIFNLSA